MRLKQWITIMMISTLFFVSISFMPSISVLAKDREKVGSYDKKDEVIYSNLTADGMVKDMYVVNTFHVKEQGNMVDYGTYKYIRNLTNLLPIEQQQDKKKIQFHADESEFYYQGELQHQSLPWEINITYLLDGEEVSPDQLANKSGRLEIHIKTSANETVDATFFDYYLLQISVTLDPEIFERVHAPKGTEAKEGKNKLISFNVMPGEEEQLVISADVETFEMEPIEISAIPANLGIDDPEFDSMKEDIQSLTDAIGDMDKGIAELKDGVTELHGGTTDLKAGSSEYLSGIQQLDQSSGSLTNGSKEIKGALKQINQAISGEDIEELPTEEDIQQLTNGLRELAAALQESAQGFQGLDAAIANIPDEIDLSTLDSILTDDNVDQGTKETIGNLINVYEIALGIKDLNTKITKPFINSTDKIASELLYIADEIEDNMSQLDELNNLMEGLLQLSSQYNEFHEGLINYTNGVHQLSNSYSDIHKGIKGVDDGTAELSKGINELHEGSTELRNETKNLPDEMQSEIDEQLASFDYSDFEPVSFVSDKNEQIGVVQFVLQTERIEIKDDEEQLIEETPKEKGIWQRFLDLFRNE